MLKKQSFNYKWVIVALSFIMVFTALGFCSSTKSLFVAPVTSALGIERSLFSLNDSFRFISTAVINIFFGTLVNKFGSKKLICAGFVSLIASSLIYSFANNVFVFYIGGCLLGIGLSWTTTTMVGYVINKWCKENKGTVMGAVLAANGLGGALATQIVNRIIHSDDNPLNYKKAYLTIAIILAVVGIIIFIFFKEKPKDYTESEVTEKKKPKRGRSWEGIDSSDAFKKAYFYGACICIFFTGLILQGIGGIAAAHLGDVGLNADYVATVLSIHSLALTGFKFLTGFLYDKLGLRFTVSTCSVAAIVVMFLLASVTNSTTGMIFAMMYGIFSSLALPLETIILPIYAADLFGEKSFNKILGIFVSVNTAGYALGAPLMNLCYDILGSYVLALLICGILMSAVLIALQFVISAGNRQHKLVIENTKTLEETA